LHAIPDLILHLESLEKIYMAGNPFIKKEEKDMIWTDSGSTIREYLREKRSKKIKEFKEKCKEDNKWLRRTEEGLILDLRPKTNEEAE
jgi:hypothetical protein